MPKRKKAFWANLQDNWSGLILGAVIVIIVALLVVNFFKNKNGDIGNGQQTDLTNQEASASAQQYKVVAGDSLSKIAEKYYGDKMLWTVLARVNKITNPNVIFVDSTLQIPSKDEVNSVREQMTQTTYKVEKGDTLFTISEKMYGYGAMWPTISKANNLGRLPNGNPLVFADSTIKIPR